jgi:hypothetical protein
MVRGSGGQSQRVQELELEPLSESLPGNRVGKASDRRLEGATEEF